MPGYVAATDGESPPLSGTLVRGFAAAFGVIADLGALSPAALVASVGQSFVALG